MAYAASGRRLGRPPTHREPKPDEAAETPPATPVGALEGDDDDPKPETPEPKMPAGYVRARITKFGDGKVATGESVLSPADGEAHFPKHKAGDMVELPKSVAAAQEKLGNLEIQS